MKEDLDETVQESDEFPIEEKGAGAIASADFEVKQEAEFAPMTRLALISRKRQNGVRGIRLPSSA